MVDSSEINDSIDLENFSRNSRFSRFDLDLDNELNRQEKGVKLEIAERNSKFFDDELDKLERWAEDRK